MSFSVIFHTSSFPDSSGLGIPHGSVLFHGASVDERGASATGFECKAIESRILVEYNYELMTARINNIEVNADKVTELIDPLVAGKNVVLESTTLGFAELFLLIRGLVDLSMSRFQIIYVEPDDYTRTKPGSDSFALSELNAGYRPIPRSVVDLAGDDVEAGVFFLGYEPERLERAFEEYQMIASKDIKVVFGIPAFRPGWELNSIVPHLNGIDNCNVQYCAANDPSSAFDALEVTRSSLSGDNKMFIAPIGTKPCGIASALFASIHPEQVGILYDHRKKSTRRSSGVSVWHRYAIALREGAQQ